MSKNIPVQFGTPVWYWPPHLTTSASVDAGTVGCAIHEVTAKCPAVVIGHEADGDGNLAAGPRIRVRYLDGNRVEEAWIDRVPTTHPARGQWWPMADATA